MAQKVNVEFIDDLDGGEAAGTVRFGLDGTEYEIDLSTEHTDELRQMLDRYVVHARRTGTARSGRRSATPEASTPESTTFAERVRIRPWYHAKYGTDLKPRGRIPGSIVLAWREDMRKAALAVQQTRETADAIPADPVAAESTPVNQGRARKTAVTAEK